MTWNDSTRSLAGASRSSWSNRILILAVAGILFLTMYPFRFSFHSMPGGASPFLLGRSLKVADFRDALLNVLLFVPFGFGLAEKLRERGRPTGLTLLVVFVSGALFSYAIEFMQLYIPERDSGWEDVVTNSSGSAVGAVLYMAVGMPVVGALNSIQNGLAAILIPRRLAIILASYFGLWFLASALMQRQACLTNWKPDAMLVIGNDSSGQYPWRGEIRELQIWSHPVAAGEMHPVDEKTKASDGAPPVLNLEFSSGQPIDSPDAASKIFWVPAPPNLVTAESLTLNGRSWLSTKTAAGDLINDLQAKNQFAVHLVCKPSELVGSDGRIVSISDSAGISNLTLRQEDTNLVFWFRTPLSSKHAQLAWYVPGVFNDYRQRDILYSYDGSNLKLWLDGRQQRNIYYVGPGTVLARMIRKVKPSELEGYNYIYYALVFFPAGAFLGFFSLATSFVKKTSIVVATTIAAAAFGLEYTLARVVGRPLSVDHTIFWIALGIAGCTWAKSDGLLSRNQ